MSFFKDMDLDKSIILISMILFPLGAWLISDTDARIALCEDSKRAATKRGGYLEEIGKLQKQIEVVLQVVQGLDHELEVRRHVLADGLGSGSHRRKHLERKARRPLGKVVTLWRVFVARTRHVLGLVRVAIDVLEDPRLDASDPVLDASAVHRFGA